MAQTPAAASWELRDEDRELFYRELNAFIPERVFDAHAHLYDLSHVRDDYPLKARLAGAPQRVTREEYQRQMDWILPGRRVEGLFLPLPAPGNLAALSAFVAAEVRGRTACRGEFLVTPEMDPEFVRQEVHRLGLAGLKCYHIFSPRNPTWESAIEEFLPEAQVRVAHQEGWCVTLHIVRPRALADPSNLETIRRYCRTYPGMKLILAHAGRGFNPHHTIEGVGRLEGLDNLWFDTSAVTDAGAIEAIVRTLGHQRLLYGSDFFVSHLRGRCLAVGDAFIWLYEHNTNWQTGHGAIRPTLIGLESLRTLKLALLGLRLTDSEIEDLFWNNARRLLELE